jgi:hypothetical protein
MSLRVLETIVSESIPAAGYPRKQVEKNKGKWLKTLSVSIINPLTQKKIFFEKVSQENLDMLLMESVSFDDSLFYYAEDSERLYFSIDIPPHVSVEHIYFGKPSPLTKHANQNIYLNKFPQILFFMVLSKVYMYIGDMEKVPIYETKANDLLSKMMLLDQSRFMDRFSDVTGKGIVNVPTV